MRDDIESILRLSLSPKLRQRPRSLPHPQRRWLRPNNFHSIVAMVLACLRYWDQRLRASTGMNRLWREFDDVGDCEWKGLHGELSIRKLSPLNGIERPKWKTRVVSEDTISGRAQWEDGRVGRQSCTPKRQCSYSSSLESI
ncbi:hypothetical protein PIB30_005635 [Stylosanthes scabra]|uniref:Uncharacterized protein n=1 Tax=Stylosanthes scabra TaxID=79078 RepID=A0ABU6T5Y3_9FABA|nr:hypothetical protein [Stylosanthes scabra]